MELHTPLPPNLRKGLTTFSGSLFINNKTGDCGVAQQYNPGHELLSSLPLQMMLYFHAFYLPFWCVSEGVMLELKYSLMPGYYQFLLLSAYLTLILVGSLRLYLGYIGNLQEKVPELAGFLLLSILIELPTLMFILFDPYSIRLPLEKAVHLGLLLFLISEITAAFFALRAMTRQLAMQFYRRQFEEDPEGPGMPGKGARAPWRSRLPIGLELAPLPAVLPVDQLISLKTSSCSCKANDQQGRCTPGSSSRAVFRFRLLNTSTREIGQGSP